MANGELIDAREAMEMLNIPENELQNLVARGDLRAFRSAGTMKFRRDDVQALKSEKGTEPTIIIPASGARKPGQSGILAAVGDQPAAPAQPAPAAPAAPAQPPAGQSGDVNATDQIILEDIELQAPDSMATQQQTVVSDPVGQGQVAPDGATIMEPSVGAAQTGEMTVVDQSADEASVGTGPAAPVAGGARAGSGQAKVGSRVGSSVGPAVSRVRQPSVAVARRTATVYEPKTAHPIWTAVLIINAAVMLFAVSVYGVMLTKGSYDKTSGQRIIPPHLKQFNVYDSFIDGKIVGHLPGRPRDPVEPGAPDYVDYSTKPTPGAGGS
jgi:hypothetical protein